MTNATKRLFIALPLPTTPQLQMLIDQLSKQLAHEKINWVKPENLHLTLKFLGTVPTSKIPDITSATSACVNRYRSFILDFNKTGIFGSRYNPKVIWLGTKTPPDILSSLADDLLNQMDNIGFRRDRQNFVPHLTLGRIRHLSSKPYFQKLINNIPQLSYLQTKVNEVILYESILYNTGPEYYVVERFNLMEDIQT